MASRFKTSTQKTILLFSIWILLLNVTFDYSSVHPSVAVPHSHARAMEDFRDERHCDSIVNNMLERSSQTTFAGEVNRLRRILGLTNPTCLERHFSFFAQEFHRRARLKHLVLHIPKTAGSSFCRVAKEFSNFTTQGENCWVKKYFCPLWCCCSKRQPLTNCKQLDSFPDFAMNENWLDLPLCLEHRLYSITLREPVDRAISHVNHLLLFMKRGWIGGDGETLGWRLNLAQSNYLTWSLASGRNATSIGVGPQFQHLAVAQDTLVRLDFLLEFSRNETCDAAVMKLMGMGNADMLHANSQKKSYIYGFRRGVYERMNDIDMELYEFSRRLMKIDCDFFLQLLQQDN